MLDKIEQSLSDLSISLHTWSKNLFYLSLFLFGTLLLLFRTPIFWGLAALLFLGAGLSVIALIRLFRRRKKLRMRLDAYIKSPEGRLSQQIRDIAQSIQRFQRRLKSYELSLREGRKHLAQIQDTLAHDQLYESRKSRHLALQKSLEKSIQQQQMIMEFYQKAKSRYEKELFNLEQDLQGLKMSAYLQQENIQQIQEEIALVETKFSLELYSEMEAFESQLPEARVESLDWDLEAQLKEMIEWLDHTEEDSDLSTAPEM